MPNTSNMPLAARYRQALGMTASQRGAIITNEACNPYSSTEQIAIFGEALDGKKARVVLIAAGRSKNSNIYSPELLSLSAEMFEGVKVFYDHKGSYSRSAKDLAGEITNVKWNAVDQQLEGTFTSLSTDSFINSLLKEAPHLVEFSVFLWAYSTDNEDGSETVEKIIKVQSVDIVHEAAAGGKVLQVLEEALASSPMQPANFKQHEGNTSKHNNEFEQKQEQGTELDKGKDTKAPEQKQEGAAEEAARKEQDAMNEAELKQALETQKENNKILQAQMDAKTEAEKVAVEKAQADAKQEASAELKKAQDELATAKAENLKLADSTTLEKYLSENTEIKPSVASAIRKTAESMTAVTVEKLEAVRKEWEAQAQAFAVDFAKEKEEDKNEDAKGKTEGGGIPPKNEDAKGKTEATTEQTVRDMIFGVLGASE